MAKLAPATVRASKNFPRDVAGHVMAVLRDDGLYRHLHFRNPRGGEYWFDLVTWPGYLAVTGDMGDYLFQRTDDMFAFFAGSVGVNLDYWAQKVVGTKGTRQFYSEDGIRNSVEYLVDDYIEEHDLDEATAASLRAAVMDEVAEDGARAALDRFSWSPTPNPGDVPPLRFSDVWEWDIGAYEYHFVWCCHAIRWGIEQYRAGGGVVVTEYDRLIDETKHLRARVAELEAQLAELAATPPEDAELVSAQSAARARP